MHLTPVTSNTFLSINLISGIKKISQRHSATCFLTTQYKKPCYRLSFKEDLKLLKVSPSLRWWLQISYFFVPFKKVGTEEEESHGHFSSQAETSSPVWAIGVTGFILPNSLKECMQPPWNFRPGPPWVNPNSTFFHLVRTYHTIITNC